MKEYTHIKHSFEPVYDKNSKILILGTLPSVKSRETEFYYGHPQNRFWRLVSQLMNEPMPESTAEKKSMLLKCGIALWDVVFECDIIGSSDSSIKNVVPADISIILESADIRCIFANGKTAEKLFNKYQKPICGREIVCLPSTSPANASWGIERLMSKWVGIKDFLDVPDNLA